MVTAWTDLDVQRDTSPPSAPIALFTFMMLLAPVTNQEPHGVTLAGYCYAMRHGMKVQSVNPYRASHLQRCGVTVRGNVTSWYRPLHWDMRSSGMLYSVETLEDVTDRLLRNVGTELPLYPRNISEVRSFDLQSCRRLKSRNSLHYFTTSLYGSNLDLHYHKIIREAKAINLGFILHGHKTMTRRKGVKINTAIDGYGPYFCISSS
jgi:hypothetical protein